jgi:hypothetical protein
VHYDLRIIRFIFEFENLIMIKENIEQLFVRDLQKLHQEMEAYTDEPAIGKQLMESIIQQEISAFILSGI